MNRTPVALSLLAVFALFVCACAGLKARDEVLPRSMGQAFASIEPQVRAGAAAQDPPLSAEQVAQIDADLAAIRGALERGARAELLSIDWPPLRALAEGGIVARAQRNEIGLGVAQSLLERLRLFSESWTAALSR